MSHAAPYHAHVYYGEATRAAAVALRERFIAHLDPAAGDPRIQFVGTMVDGPAGPHPIPQYEVHFHAAARAAVIALIEAAGLRALVHPLTDDDLADHTTLGQWIGEPVVLDTSVLDPPGVNQGLARFGVADF